MAVSATDVVTSPGPVRERGYAIAANPGLSYWNDLATERTPELRWPFCIGVYEDMTAQDSQVSSVLRAVISPILRTGWRLDGDGCRPEVVTHVATDLGLPIKGEGNTVPAVRTRGRFSWSEHLTVALEDYLTFGHAYFEQVYRLDENGMLRLRKLGYRPPRTISAVNVAPDGGLVSIEQIGSGGLTTIVLPVNRLVAYVYGRKGGNWIGRSLLRPAYKNWILKDRLLRVQAMTVERNGMGIPVYSAAPGEVSLDAGLQIASDVRAGDNSGTAIPNGAGFDLRGVSGQLPDADIPIRYHDEQIARAVLAHFLNLGTQTGSWALGSTFADFFTQSLQAIAEDMRNTATQHIVEDIVDVNWGPTEPAPRLVFDEIGSRSDAIVGAIASLVHEGVLHADADLEQYLRTELGLPDADPAVDSTMTDQQPGGMP